jgi:hypothetical protein
MTSITPLSFASALGTDATCAPPVPTISSTSLQTFSTTDNSARSLNAKTIVVARSEASSIPASNTPGLLSFDQCMAMLKGPITSRPKEMSWDDLVWITMFVSGGMFVAGLIYVKALDIPKDSRCKSDDGVGDSSAKAEEVSGYRVVATRFVNNELRTAKGVELNHEDLQVLSNLAKALPADDDVYKYIILENLPAGKEESFFDVTFHMRGRDGRSKRRVLSFRGKVVEDEGKSSTLPAAAKGEVRQPEKGNPPLDD